MYWKSYGILLLYNTIQYPIPLPSQQTNLKLKVHTKAASNAGGHQTGEKTWQEHGT